MISVIALLFATLHRAPTPVFGLNDSMQVEIESANVTFGNVPPGERREYPSAIVVRVRSPRPWALRLIATTPFNDRGSGKALDWQRLQWRRLPGSYQPFGETGVIVARGSPTAPSGEVVAIDLSLGFGPNDGVGEYSCAFRLTFDSF